MINLPRTVVSMNDQSDEIELRIAEPQRCPICSKEVHRSLRYPRYLCRECAHQAVSADGLPLRFADLRKPGHGFRAFAGGTGEAQLSYECFSRGVKCYVHEAHLGGIVVRPVE